MRWRAEQRTQTILQAIGCLAKDVAALRCDLLNPEGILMSTLADAITADQELAAEVQQLIDAYEALLAAQTSGADQAQIDQLTTDLNNTKASVAAALTPPTPPAT